MSTTLFILAGALVSAGVSDPGLPYTLDHPGFVFEWLPSTMVPPVEGTLSEQSGEVVSSPSGDGSEYRLHYWNESIPAQGRGEWLEQRIKSELPPEDLDMLLTSEVAWLEGSMESAERAEASVGLVLAMNFNLITEDGGIIGRGRACGVFGEGYSLLVFGIAPYEAGGTLCSGIDTIVARMHRL